MYRPAGWTISPSNGHSHRWRETWARLLTPITIWICVAATLRYGYYGDCRMVLGVNSSRLVKASSLFVEKVKVLDEDKKGVFLYSFSDKPELSSETNWSVSNYVIVGAYSSKRFSLWLNQGSRISLRLEAPSQLLNRLETVVLKGEQKYETLMPKSTSNRRVVSLNESTEGKQVEYDIEEDDRYRLDIINSNSRSIIIMLSLNVSAKMYDISKAKNSCSTTKGSCQLGLLFPYTHYVILTTPSNDHLDTWYLELSFMARVATYVAILCFIVAFLFVILKFLGACDDQEPENPVVENTYHTVREITESDPILPDKPNHYAYGTPDHHEDDNDSGGSSSSSEDLYDAKLCVICYDDQRNCFFVPCGHCATCYDCAQRIMDGESRVCPICRRLIHKARRLFNS